jgi:hypothetical protein
MTRFGVPRLYLTREEKFDFLESLATCLRECQEELRRSEETHDAKDDEHSPSDVLEAWRNVHAQGKVEKLRLSKYSLIKH